MDKEQVLAILRDHEPELKAAGLLHLCLFGSVARGDNTPTSDVDLLFDYNESGTENLLDAFGFENRVSEILGIQVHLTSKKHLKPRIRDRVLSEAVDAF